MFFTQVGILRSSKVISRLISLRYLLGFTGILPQGRSGPTGTAPKLGRMP